MRILIALAALAGLPALAWAQQDNMARVTLEDGSTLMCKIKIQSVHIDTEAGAKDVPIHKVREITLSKLGDELVTIEGTLKGRIKWEDVKATSDVGMLTLWRDQVKKLEIFLAKTPDGKHPDDQDKPKVEDPDKPYEIPDMGINDPDHDSRCYLGGGRIILDFQKNFRASEHHGGYFFDLKTVESGLADGFSTCRQCMGSGWAVPGYERYGPYEEGDECPYCGGKGSFSIWKGTMHICIHCGRTH